MVKAKTTIDSWQHLYRALLRSSAASVRFSRPAARNTRRYLRDEFARALVADEPTAAGPSSDRSAGRDDALSNVAGTASTIAPNPTGGASSSQSPRRWQLSSELLHRQTHNTLAFHLSAALLSSSTTERRLLQTDVTDAAEILAIDDARLCKTSGSRGNSRDTFGCPPPGNDTMSTPSTEAKRPSRPTKTERLAHRVISNLSSLTYHHLSPHTQMQSRAHLKQNRARKPQKLSSLARVLGKMEADVALEPTEGSNNGIGLSDMLSSGGGARATGGGGETTLNALHMKLGFLMPSVKPVRGPVSARLKEWDGQNSDKIASEGSLRQMESDLGTIEKLLEQHDADAKNNGDARKQPALGKQVQQLKSEAEQLRRKIKAATKTLAQAEAREELESIPIGHLADLVAAAQDSEQLLLGKDRWMRRKNGEFLAP